MTDDLTRALARIKIKDAIRRQATIRPEETMFDGVSPVVYGLGGRHLRTVDTIRHRVQALESWIDSELIGDRHYKLIEKRRHD